MIFQSRLRFDSHDEVREFFLSLQNEVRNLNYLPFHSERYEEAVQQIKKMIELKSL
jgi:V/A-type H+-transporting ATPase subunit A